MISRTSKQVYISLVYIVLIGLLIWSVTDYFFITESTCSDGIQNGKEEGVDCGTLACGYACPEPVQPIRVVSSQLLEVSNNDYDALIQVTNPNTTYGARSVNYVANLFSDSGDVVAAKKGSFYIMPGETTYVVVQSIETSSAAIKVELDIEEASWQKLSLEDKPVFENRRTSLLIPNRVGLYAEFEAVVFNRSFFDFEKVDARVVLYNTEDEIVGVATTDVRTFLSNTERYFRVFWPNTLAGEPVRADVEVSTNIFESSNFIRTRGIQEPFQLYY